MSNTVISVENLSKSYRLGSIGTGTFYGDLKRWWARQRGKPDPYVKIGETDYGNQDGKTIWALKDVNFTVQQGQALGIIGRNGAGKSTLLKMLSRVTSPSSGTIKVKGRIASLLEVGTGFHPELTGRENIYLNGAIMGMSSAEVNRKFDEIIDFSGVEQFIDTPVKRYSSGMYVRLAFAVAAHLEPEILIVDEVLAVGDAAFQKKCLGKMSHVAHEGRTVLFVSHNMHAVANFCENAIWLNKGQIQLMGNTSHVIDQYLADETFNRSDAIWDFTNAPGNDCVRLKAIRVSDQSGSTLCNARLSEPISVEMEYWVLKPNMILNPNFHIYNHLDNCLFATGNFHDSVWNDRAYEPGLYKATCLIPGHYFNEGRYTVSAIVVKDKNEPQARVEQFISFNVYDDNSSRGGHVGNWIGLVRPLLPWTVQKVEESR
jgi:lipopolysaccharide transport system ATP-binding protein